MMLLPDHEAVFVSTPKCGTHTMYEVLKQFGGKRHSEFHHRDSPSHTKNWLHFTVVRNPYSRAVASWQWALQTVNGQKVWKGLPDRSFETFTTLLATRRTGWMPTIEQSRWHSTTKVTTFLHIEHLAEEFAELPFVDEPVDMPVLNRSEHADWESLMTPEIVQHIRAWAPMDFELYGYPIEWQRFDD